MQRMDPSVLHGAARGDKGLGGHLATEDPLALLVRLNAPEDVHLNRLEVEQVDEELERCTHRTMIAGGRCTRGERSGDGPATLRRHGDRPARCGTGASGVP